MSQRLFRRLGLREKFGVEVGEQYPFLRFANRQPVPRRIENLHQERQNHRSHFGVEFPKEYRACVSPPTAALPSWRSSARNPNSRDDRPPSRIESIVMYCLKDGSRNLLALRDRWSKIPKISTWISEVRDHSCGGASDWRKVNEA